MADKFGYSVKAVLSDATSYREGVTRMRLDYHVTVGRWDGMYSRGVEEKFLSEVITLTFSSSGMSVADENVGRTIHPAVFPSYFVEDYSKEGHERAARHVFAACGSPRISGSLWSARDASRVMGLLSKVFEYEGGSSFQRWMDKLPRDKQALIYNMDDFARFMLHLHLAGAVHVGKSAEGRWSEMVEHCQFRRDNLLSWLYYANEIVKEISARNMAEVEAQTVNLDV